VVTRAALLCAYCGAQAYLVALATHTAWLRCTRCLVDQSRNASTIPEEERTRFVDLAPFGVWEEQ
jgi:hypothetical protein